MVALALGWYLLATTLASTLLRLARAGRAASMAEAFALPSVRRLTRAAAGLTLTAAALTTTGPLVLAAETASAIDAHAPEPPPTMRRLPDQLPTTTNPPPTTASVVVRGAEVDAGPPGTPAPDSSTTTAPPADTTTTTERPAPPAARPMPTMRRLPKERPPTTTTAATTTTTAAARPAPATTWTVRPGDHFWRIAEEVLTAAWHRAPTDAEITPYWWSLVEHNRAGLANPHNPDLLFPGQEIGILPPPEVSIRKVPG
jgi:hypothetical protein